MKRATIAALLGLGLTLGACAQEEEIGVKFPDSLKLDQLTDAQKSLLRATIEMAGIQGGENKLTIDTDELRAYGHFVLSLDQETETEMVIRLYGRYSASEEHSEVLLARLTQPLTLAPNKPNKVEVKESYQTSGEFRLDINRNGVSNLEDILNDVNPAPPTFDFIRVAPDNVQFYSGIEIGQSQRQFVLLQNLTDEAVEMKVAVLDAPGVIVDRVDLATGDVVREGAQRKITFRRVEPFGAQMIALTFAPVNSFLTWGSLLVTAEQIRTKVVQTAQAPIVANTSGGPRPKPPGYNPAELPADADLGGYPVEQVQMFPADNLFSGFAIESSESAESNAVDAGTDEEGRNKFPPLRQTGATITYGADGDKFPADQVFLVEVPAGNDFSATLGNLTGDVDLALFFLDENDDLDSSKEPMISDGLGAESLENRCEASEECPTQRALLVLGRREEEPTPAARNAQTVGTVVNYRATATVNRYPRFHEVTPVVPPSGEREGGITIAVSGYNFHPQATVYLGEPSRVCYDQTFEVADQAGVVKIKCTLPEGPAMGGPVSVVVRNPLPTVAAGGDGQVAFLDQGFTYYPPAPQVTEIWPPKGPVAGGTPLTVRGDNFDSEGGGPIVFLRHPDMDPSDPASLIAHFSAQEGTASNIDANTIRNVIMPAHDVGMVRVSAANCKPGKVIGDLDPNKDCLAAANHIKGRHVAFFEYIVPQGAAPTVTDVTPNQTPVFGGNNVFVGGENFISGAQVMVGNTLSSAVTFNSATQLKVRVPEGDPGWVRVAVVNPDGQIGTLEEALQYVVPRPEIITITPRRVSRRGGDKIAVDGTGFWRDLRAEFVMDPAATAVGSGSAALDIQRVSSSRLVVTCPGVEPAGSYYLRLYYPGLTDPGVEGYVEPAVSTNPVDFLAPAGPAPEIFSISPASGLVGQPVPVAITGLNFDAVPDTESVTVGYKLASNIRRCDANSQERICFNTPVFNEEAQAVVVVQNADGQSASTTFRFYAPPPQAPIITWVEPESSFIPFNSFITIQGYNFGRTLGGGDVIRPPKVFSGSQELSYISSGPRIGEFSYTVLGSGQQRIRFPYVASEPHNLTVRIENPWGVSASTVIEFLAEPAQCKDLWSCLSDEDCFPDAPCQTHCVKAPGASDETPGSCMRRCDPADPDSQCPDMMPYCGRSQWEEISGEQHWSQDVCLNTRQQYGSCYDDGVYTFHCAQGLDCTPSFYGVEELLASGDDIPSALQPHVMHCQQPCDPGDPNNVVCGPMGKECLPNNAWVSDKQVGPGGQPLACNLEACWNGGGSCPCDAAAGFGCLVDYNNVSSGMGVCGKYHGFCGHSSQPLPGDLLLSWINQSRGGMDVDPYFCDAEQGRGCAPLAPEQEGQVMAPVNCFTQIFGEQEEQSPTAGACLPVCGFPTGNFDGNDQAEIAFNTSCGADLHCPSAEFTRDRVYYNVTYKGDTVRCMDRSDCEYHGFYGAECHFWNFGTDGEGQDEPGYCAYPYVLCRDCSHDAREPRMYDGFGFEPSIDLSGELPVEGLELGLCPGDYDLFRFEAQELDTIVARVDFLHAAGDINLVLKFSPSGEAHDAWAIQESATQEDFEQIVYPVEYLETDGYFLLYVYSSDPMAQNDYTLDLSIDCTDAFEPNDTQQTAWFGEEGGDQMMGPPILCPQDQDWYRVHLEAGQRVELWMSAQNGIVQPRCELTGPGLGGGLPCQTNATGSRVEYTPSVAGDYFLHVFHLAGSEDNLIVYDLSGDIGDPPVPDAGFDAGQVCEDDSVEPNDQSYFATSYDRSRDDLGNHGFHDLKICTDNEDWFSFHVGEMPSSIVIDLTFSHAEGDLDLYLFDDPYRTPIASRRSESDNENMRIPAPHTGIYYVRVVGYRGSSNSYDLSVDVVVCASTFNCDEAQAGTCHVDECGAVCDKCSSEQQPNAYCSPETSQCQCQPSCSPGFCGANGCGGTCGCPDQWSCNTDTANCEPPPCVNDPLEGDPDNNSWETAYPLASKGELGMITPAVLCPGAGEMPGDVDFYNLGALGVFDQIEVAVALDRPEYVQYGIHYLPVEGTSTTQVGNWYPGGTIWQLDGFTVFEEGTYFLSIGPQYGMESLGYDFNATVTPCVRQCAGECGDDDGCGGDCGTCDASPRGYCTESFMCSYPPAPCTDDDLEPNDDPAEASSIDVGMEYNGLTVCDGDDLDYYTFTLNSPATIKLWSEWPTISYELECHLWLEGDPEIQRQCMFNYDRWEVPADLGDGTYILQVSRGDTSVPVYYNLEVALGSTSCDLDDWEPNDYEGDATWEYSRGSPQYATLCDGDEDWYGMYLYPEQPYNVVVFARGPDPDGIRCQVKTPRGVIEDCVAGEGGYWFLSSAAASEGSYYMRVWAPYGGEWEYDFGVDTSGTMGCGMDVFEPNNGRLDSGVYPGNWPSPGNQASICADDVDWYAFYVDAGSEVTLGVPGEVWSYHYCEVVNSDGNHVTECNNYAGAVATFTAQYTGVYYLHVWAEPVGGEVSYYLFLEVSAGTGCIEDVWEPNDTSPGTIDYPLNNRTTANLCPGGDNDWYMFRLEGQDVPFRTEVWPGGPDPVMCEVQTPTGMRPCMYGEDSMYYDAVGSGAYSLHVWSPTDAEVDYDFHVSVGGVMPCQDDFNEENDDFDSATAGEIGYTYYDLQICPGDVDFWQFCVDGDGTLDVVVDYQHQGNGDIDVRLFSQAQTLLTSSTGITGHEEISIPASTECYYVMVEEYQNDGQNSYQLRVDFTPSGCIPDCSGYTGSSCGPDGCGGVCLQNCGFDEMCNLEFMICEGGQGCMADPFEPNNTQGQASTGYYLESQNPGSICPDGDADWYAINIAEAGTLVVDVSNLEQVPYALGCMVMTPAAGPIPCESSDGINGHLELPVTPGPYFLYVAAISSGEWTYMFQVSQGSGTTCTDDHFEDNDNTSQATPLGLGGEPTPAYICPGDPDIWELSVDTDGILNVEVLYEHDPSGDINIELFDGTGYKIAGEYSQDDDEYLSAGVVAGTYYIYIYAPNSGMNSYQLSANLGCLDPFEPNDYYERLVEDTPLNVENQAYICPASDQDWYRFSIDGWDPIPIGAIVRFVQPVSEMPCQLMTNLQSMIDCTTGDDGYTWIANGSSDNEGFYYLHVWSPDVLPNPYTFQISVGQ